MVIGYRSKMSIFDLIKFFIQNYFLWVIRCCWIRKKVIFLILNQVSVVKHGKNRVFGFWEFLDFFRFFWKSDFWFQIPIRFWSLNCIRLQSLSLSNILLFTGFVCNYKSIIYRKNYKIHIWLWWTILWLICVYFNSIIK